MNGPDLLAYVQRRLAEKGLSVPTERVDELYDLITEGRDEVKLRLAQAGSVVVMTTITLEQDGQLYSFPDAMKDPIQVLEVREAGTGEPLDPALHLNRDGGHYRWNGFRQVQLADSVSPNGGIEVVAVLADAAITEASTEAEIGLPTPCHRAAGMYAAWKAVTADEESDGTALMGEYEKAMGRLEQVYGDFDRSSGLAVRHGIMRTMERFYGDTLDN